MLAELAVWVVLTALAIARQPRLELGGHGQPKLHVSGSPKEEGLGQGLASSPGSQKRGGEREPARARLYE